MALHWTPKAPGDVTKYRWVADDCDSIQSYSLTVATGTVTLTEKIEGSSLVVTVTGGVDGVTQVLAAEATLSGGAIVTETIYLPIIETAERLGQTGRDIAHFALRKVTGNDSDPEASELNDALERLSDMLAAWKGQGADLGIPLPVGANDVLQCSDEHISALKNNLIVEIADLYGFEPSMRVIANAFRGLQQIKMAKLSKGPRPDPEGYRYQSDYY